MKAPLTILTLTLGVLAMTSPAHAQGHFVQDRFVISFWVDPPVDDARYAEIADANFTVVLGANASANPETTKKAMDLCDKYGLKLIVWRGATPADQLAEGPTLWGYALRDEPTANDFADLRKQVDEIRVARPGKLAYINLFPNYANEQQMGTKTYDEHVKRFVDEVGVDVLSMDHYPVMHPGENSCQSYCDNLEVMRHYSLEKGIPFWNYFNTMPFGPHFDPTEHALRWQIMTSLAYGAKGVMYFCYWTPQGAEFPKGGAIITAEGRKTRHYDQAKRLNAAVKAMGPTLMKLTSQGVVHLAPGADAALLATTPLKSLAPSPKGDYLIGTFKHADGRRAVLLNNYDYCFTSWPTVEFGADLAQVREVDQATGQEVPVVDDSPDMPGLQLSLDAGGGRLFLLP